MKNPNQIPLSVKYLSIATLTAHPSNARTHSKKQIRQIAESIKAFGFTNPILIDDRNTIIAGHGRVEAAKILGLSQVPTIHLEHLTPDEKRAYIIADNRLAEKAGWDKAILAIELQHLIMLDGRIDVTITGFEVPEIDIIIDGASGNEDKEDNFQFNNTEPPVTKSGDLWLLGPHRVLCGNALEKSSYDTLMQNKQAHLIITDPPYNVRIDGHVSGLGVTKHREFAMASGEMSEAEFISFLTRACSLMARNSFDGSIHFIFLDWRHAGEILEAGRLVYTELKNICAWVKDNGGMGSLYRSQHEFIFVFKHGKAPHQNNIQLGKYGRYRTNVWNYPCANSFSKQSDEGNLLALHPTVKPIALIADAILDCSSRGDIVLDPFLGSGTTVLAAERVGRVCYGLELDPLYVDTIIRRWQKYTGQSAINAGSGKSFGELTSIPEVSHG